MANVRVEFKYNIGNNRSDRERAALSLLRQFKRAVDAAGIIAEIKEHERYEKPGDKKRRKRKQAELQRKYAALGESNKNKERPDFRDGFVN